MVRLRYSLQILGALSVAASLCLQHFAQGIGPANKTAPMLALRHRAPR